MDRLISLQAAIDALCEDYCFGHHDCKRYPKCENLRAIQKLPSAQPEQQWIPVTERLPEYGTAVLTYNDDDEYEINHIIDEDDGEWFWNGVVAWMPLPEPYKEGDNERA